LDVYYTFFKNAIEAIVVAFKIENNWGRGSYFKRFFRKHRCKKEDGHQIINENKKYGYAEQE